MIVGVWYRSPDIFPACFMCVPTKRVFAFLPRVCRTDGGFSAPTETGEAVSQHPEQHGCRGRAQGECVGQESPRELLRPSICALLLPLSQDGCCPCRPESSGFSVTVPAASPPPPCRPTASVEHL